MASSSNSRHGAAEEPGPPPPSTSSRAPYDPSQFQRPHPDDRGGGGGETSKRKPKTKTGTKTKASAKASDTTKPKPAAEEGEQGKGKSAPPADICAWCEALGAKLRCGQCKSKVYCGEKCQRVGVLRKGLATTTIHPTHIPPASATGSTRPGATRRPAWP